MPTIYYNKMDSIYLPKNACSRRERCNGWVHCVLSRRENCKQKGSTMSPYLLQHATIMVYIYGVYFKMTLEFCYDLVYVLVYVLWGGVYFRVCFHMMTRRPP